MLSQFAGRKIGIECACGLRRRYDATAMLARLGHDIDMPTLKKKLSTAEGCDRKDLMERSLCTVGYDEATVEMFMAPTTRNESPR